jgi:DNA-binding transcriptional regulator YdaS (Cro superfamily)
MKDIDWKDFTGRLSVESLMERFGNQTEMAAFCGVAPSTIYQWRLKNNVPAEYVLMIERKTGVPRFAIRPDIYPREA